MYDSTVAVFLEKVGLRPVFVQRLWLLSTLIFFLLTSHAEAYWRLQWTDNSMNESGFRVERKIKNQGYKQIGQTNADISTYNDTTSVAGTQYCYRLVAFNQIGATTGPQTCAKQPR